MKPFTLGVVLGLLACVCSGASAAPAVDDSSSFEVRAPLSRDGATVTVKVVPQEATSNWHYDIHLTTTDGLDQHFRIRNGQPITRKDIRLADLTADGFLDIMIVGGKDHRGEDWFKTLLYDPKAKKYKWINDR